MRAAVIDPNVDALAREGRIAIYGDAARSELLEQAGIVRASYLLLSASLTPNDNMLVSAVSGMNMHARLIIRARYLREAEAFQRVDAGATVVDDVESAAALAELVLYGTSMGEQLNLLVAMDDAQAGRGSQDAGGQKHDQERLAQLLADDPEEGRQAQDGGDFVKCASVGHSSFPGDATLRRSAVDHTLR